MSARLVAGSLKPTFDAEVPQKGFLRVPLLRQALTDPCVQIRVRAVDHTWGYQKVIPVSVAGFNPYHRTLFVAETSMLARWLRHPAHDDRRFNERDFLAYEVLYVVHDYLHIWASMVIQEEMPELDLGHGRITRASLETFAFCHLVTEAVATVGLDYWYLSTINLRRLCDNGTTMRTLAVSYHEDDLREFRHHDRTLDLQRPDAFEKIATFYCTGAFPGFSGSSVRRSATVLAWLEHELNYGRKQREYTREWLAYLSGSRLRLSKEQLGDPIVCDRPWQRRLMARVGERLWAKVKNDERSPAFRNLPPRSSIWKSGAVDQLDARFTNLNRIDPKVVADPRRWNDQFDYWFFQRISAFAFSTFPSALRPVLRSLKEKKDVGAVEALLTAAGAKPAGKTSADEPTDIFFPN